MRFKLLQFEGSQVLLLAHLVSSCGSFFYALKGATSQVNRKVAFTLPSFARCQENVQCTG
uniref:60S ribosomal protein L22 n=1 Tax=Parascaris univalens TaxID=6257 RepID=A0A915BV62_PARUN